MKKRFRYKRRGRNQKTQQRWHSVETNAKRDYLSRLPIDLLKLICCHLGERDLKETLPLLSKYFYRFYKEHVNDSVLLHSFDIERLILSKAKEISSILKSEEISLPAEIHLDMSLVSLLLFGCSVFFFLHALEISSYLSQFPNLSHVAIFRQFDSNLIDSTIHELIQQFYIRCVIGIFFTLLFSISFLAISCLFHFPSELSFSDARLDPQCMIELTTQLSTRFDSFLTLHNKNISSTASLKQNLDTLDLYSSMTMKHSSRLIKPLQTVPNAYKSTVTDISFFSQKGMVVFWIKEQDKILNERVKKETFDRITDFLNYR